MIEEGKQIKTNVYIRKNNTKEIRKIEMNLYGFDSDTCPETWIWEEGNYSCDCNREIFFERAAGFEVEEVECSHFKYSIKLEDPKTGNIFYNEFDEEI